MTTAEFIVCELMGCGQMDIESCFGKMDDDILVNAISRCKDEFGTTDMGAIWQIAIEDAANDVFGDYELVEPQFNYMASDVAFVGDPDEIEDFEAKAEEFANLTGFDLQY
ncbi:MAG: hypothetical protein IKS48_00550 [Eubacterium sp.]|nr:hypothetical protein [Eubacterium sp.]